MQPTENAQIVIIGISSLYLLCTYLLLAATAVAIHLQYPYVSQMLSQNNVK